MIPFNYVIENTHKDSPNHTHTGTVNKDKNAVIGQRGVVKLHTMPLVYSLKVDLS